MRMFCVFSNFEFYMVLIHINNVNDCINQKRAFRIRFREVNTLANVVYTPKTNVANVRRLMCKLVYIIFPIVINPSFISKHIDRYLCLKKNSWPNFSLNLGLKIRREFSINTIGDLSFIVYVLIYNLFKFSSTAITIKLMTKGYAFSSNVITNWFERRFFAIIALVNVIIFHQKLLYTTSLLDFLNCQNVVNELFSKKTFLSCSTLLGGRALSVFDKNHRNQNYNGFIFMIAIFVIYNYWHSARSLSQEKQNVMLFSELVTWLKTNQAT